MSTPKTIGVIGLGSAGMRHAKNLLAMGHDVFGLDPDSSRMNDLFEVGGSSLEKSRMPFKPDGLVIASPTSNHAQQLDDLGWIREPLLHEASTPLFVEKPIADRLVEVPKNLIMVGNNLRFHSCVKKAKEWLSEGLIGKLLWASFVVAQHNTKYTDPVVLNWGAHEFDLALYLLGPATVTAAAGNNQIFDTCLLHEYGVPSTIHCDYVTDPERRAFQVYGDKGQIFVNLVSRTASLLDRAENVLTRAYRGHGGDTFDQDYKDEIAAFIDLIDGKPVPHAATGEDGLHALELILEAQRMAEK